MFTTKEVNFSHYGVLVCWRLWISGGTMEKRSERRTESRPLQFLIIFTDREPEKRCTYDVMSSECERLGPYTDIW